jgi:electron transfer flavoprotein alpha subunit
VILTYIEIRDNRVKKASLETLGEAGRLAGELKTESVAAVVCRSAAEAPAAELPAYGAARVYVLENEGFGRYSAQDHACALAELAKKISPSAIFFPGTALGRDLAPRLAAKLGVGVASDCTRVAVKDGRLEFTRPVYAGKALLTFGLTSSPPVATLRPNVFPVARPAAGASGEVVRESVGAPSDRTRAEVTEIVGGAGEEIDVAEAEVIVSGGRGMKGPENFELLRELTRLIPKSAVGASRSAVDSGWIGHEHQVGQTGKTVSPNLYLAFGISGAIQHIAGMSSSKVIAAVNKDPDAPIFKVADFGVVGDLFEVIPRLRDEIKKLRSE